MYGIKKAFTLAEVLITLLIIGVISSIVIPGIINNTNESEYNIGVKKIYADLSTAVKMIQANNGGSVAVGNGTSLADYIAFRDDFCSVMACVKKDTGTNIFGPTIYKYYKGGNSLSQANNIDSSAILNNGTILQFISSENCTQYGVNACGRIFIDINGQKGPNMWAKDMYVFYVVRKNGDGVYSIFPAGTQNDGVYFPSTCSIGSGLGCAAVRLTNPENMPY